MTDAENETDWPPKDGASFVRSGDFGSLVVKIAKSLTEQYRSMDFTNAVARLFVWFDDKLKIEGDFINASRFPSLSSFRAYIRKAIWNDARRTARSEANRHVAERRHGTRSPTKETKSAENAGMLSELIDQLPEPHCSITRGLLLAADDVASLAQTLGISESDVQQLYEESIDMLTKPVSDAP